jgi:hypothetical protein
VTNSSDPTGGFSANLEAIAKVAAGIVLAFYVIGLIAINGYLFGLGASDFSLLRPRFVYTGALIGFSAVLFIVAPYSMALVFLRNSYLPARIFAVVLIVASGCISFVIFLVNPGLSMGDMLRSSAILLAVGLLCAFQVATLSMWRIVKERPRLDPLALNTLAVGITLLIVGIVAYVIAFMVLYFPKIPAQFGGGKPAQVALLIKRDEIDGVRALGLPIETRRPLGGETSGKQPSPETGYVTSPLDLMYEGSEAYVLRLADGTLIRLDKDAVVAVKASGSGAARALGPDDGDRHAALAGVGHHVGGPPEPP